MVFSLAILNIISEVRFIIFSIFLEPIKGGDALVYFFYASMFKKEFLQTKENCYIFLS